ncbi:MAG: pyruvate formate lyase family protein [Promethearchaeota archaeon]
MQIAQSINPKTSYSLKCFNIQRTCVHDGPGIRTTIFFQGCNLRCLWCQNPEGQFFQGDLGSECNYTIDDIIENVSRDKSYYFLNHGGVTLSGGEPLLQDPDSLIYLLELLKKDKINIAAETTLHAPWENIKRVAPYIDLFLVDIKIVGDEDLHKKCTKFDSTLIHNNIKKLLDLNVKIKFRMVMVPGYTDGEKNIKATAEFLKSINYNTIELLRYHNLYEDKAKKLGLDYVSLNITPDQALESLEKGIKLFRLYGIKAENKDLEPKEHKALFTPRVKRIQRDIRSSPRALCIETSKLRTKYYRKYKGFKKPTPIHRAERLAYVMKNKKVKVYPQELLVGNFTSKRVAGNIWEELYGSLPIIYVPFVNFQKPVPFQCSFKDIAYFVFRIAPHWFKNSLMMRVNTTIPEISLAISHSAEMCAGFNNNMAQICHFIANYDVILKKGTIGLIEEVKQKAREKPDNNQDFYKGVIITLEALGSFGEKYAEYLMDLAEKEKDPERRKELENMIEVCKHVPKYPARTFHEAIQSIVFIHIALCLEQFENAISFGRLDQILYPYYKKDKEAGLITYEKAKELICLFVLKMDELIFVNDGNSLLQLYKSFETLSTDQALTFGGVDKDGKDATNDVTYMFLDACELQTLSIDPAARIHENSPDKYLERIAELYINGCPMPQLFSDNIYVETILKHYPVSIEQARNYAIVGCVEPNASDDHFGNTDCANVNIALPFLQALKGHEHELWNYGLRDQLQRAITNLLDYFFKRRNKFSRFIMRLHDKLIMRYNYKKGLYFYNPPSNMYELQERFQKRLNQLTKGVLEEHQKIERVLRARFTTPLASSLSRGCIEKGKDLYEGGAEINSSGIQPVGVVDVADSLYAINEVVFKRKLYTLKEVIHAIDTNFQGKKNQKIRSALLAVPKFGDDSSSEPSEWVTKVMEIWNNALDSVPNCPRKGRYSAGYYALNVANRYGKRVQALPSGRLKGEPLANSIMPHYGMEQKDLLSALNSISRVNFVDHAENGATATFTIDSALFSGKEGVRNLANIFKTFLTSGGMQLQPNVINREILLEAYKDPNKYPNLLVRIAGYCAYFNELSDEMKLHIINRTSYS